MNQKKLAINKPAAIALLKLVRETALAEMVRRDLYEQWKKAKTPEAEHEIRSALRLLDTAETVLNRMAS